MKNDKFRAETLEAVMDRTDFNVSSIDSERSFLRSTYIHLLGAIIAFIGIEYILFKTGIAARLAPIMSNNWLLIIGGFMILGFLTSYFTSKSSNKSAQYTQLAVTVMLQSIIFIPLLAYAVYLTDSSVLFSAAAISLAIFGTMTAIVVYSGKDFSFIGPFLGVIGIAVMIGIVGAVIFKVTLGFYFAIAMVVFSAATILYETSKIVHRYGPGQHVIAATGLFASVAMLFYYVLSALISRD